MNCLILKKNNSKTKGSYLYLKEGDEVVECDLIIICEHEIAVGGMRNISRPDGDCCYRNLLGIQA